MSTHEKTAEDIARDIVEFAKRHGLVVPNRDCLANHARRVVELGRCPCVEGRPDCPCADALADVERLGRCECGILIDPVRICMIKQQNGSQ